MSKRKPMSKKLRFDVFKRDSFTCQYCGGHPPKSILHVDHINPVKLGGDNDINNLVTSCSLCNLGKSATPLNVIPKSLKDKAKETKERELQIAGYAEIMEESRLRIEEDAWKVAEILDQGARDGYLKSRLGSIKRFVNELGVSEVIDAAEIGYSRFPHNEDRAFKYFCGVCWRLIKGDEA